MAYIKSFKDYFAETEKEYHLRIKTLVELTDERVDRIEHALKKYDLRDVSRPKKTIMQRHPLDFQLVDHGEVWVLDVTLGIPASAYVVQQELRTVLEISETFIVVRTDNDPMEIENERQNALHDIDSEAKEKGLTRDSLLSVDSNYTAGETGATTAAYYGNEYNKGLLNYLGKVAATRKPEIIEPQSSLFDFIGDTKIEASNDFNEKIEDAPKSVPWWEALDNDVSMDDVNIAPTGNFDDDVTAYTRTYTDPKNGKRKDLSVTTSSIRQIKKGKK